MTARRGLGEPTDTGGTDGIQAEASVLPSGEAVSRSVQDATSSGGHLAATGVVPPWAERLQALVARSGLRQAEIARRAGMQRDALGRYVRGLTRPPAAKLAALARVLGVPPADIDPDRRDLVGVEPPDAGPPIYRLTPARSGDPERMYLEVTAEVDRATALAIVDLLTHPRTFGSAIDET